MLKKLRLKLRDKEFVLSFLVYILLFIFCLYPYRDYDWGWHYKNGEYFLTHWKILVADQYSWTMAGYKWVNHEWLYDPFHYLIFKYTSFLGMTLVGAALSVSWFYLGVKRYNLSFWQKAVLALFFSNMIGGVVWQGLRVQMVGTLFIAVLIYLIPDIAAGKKKVLISLPFMFLLWANLHGYFIIGIALLGLILFGGFVEQVVKMARLKGRLFIPKSLFFGGICFVMCFLATLINPFTYHVYLEGLRHLHNPLLQYILEWIPFSWNSSFSLIILFYTLFIAVGFIRRRKLSDLPYIFIFIFMFYYALTARRYVSTYAVISLPMVAFILKDIPLKLERFKTTAFVFVLCCAIAFEIGLFRRIPNYHLLNYTFNDYCSMGSNCSEKMVAYLKKHPPKGKGLNFYDWGGYLIGRGVPAKLFIDGRMHLWKDDKTGFQPFLAYQKMYYDEDYETFKKYDFDWLIIGTDSPLFRKLNETKDLGIWNAVFGDGINVYLVRVRK